LGGIGLIGCGSWDGAHGIVTTWQPRETKNIPRSEAATPAARAVACAWPWMPQELTQPQESNRKCVFAAGAGIGALLVAAISPHPRPVRYRGRLAHLDPTLLVRLGRELGIGLGPQPRGDVVVEPVRMGRKGETPHKFDGRQDKIDAITL
jgi:hypothetical protein